MMLEYFSDLQISVIPIVKTLTINEDTGREVETEEDGTPFDAIKYNRSVAERYYSQTYAEGITDILVCDSDNGITNKSTVRIDGVKWECSEPVNVAEQDEVYTIGIKRIAG